VPIKKINTRRLSRNFRTTKAPLHVLPMTSLFQTRHRLKQQTKQQAVPDKVSQSTIQCAVEEVVHTRGKRVKKSGRKGPITIRPFMSIHFTMTALRWIFLVIFIYIACGTAIVMIQDGTESLKNIVIYSIIGFFTFFMGYLGWILARDVLEVVSGKKLVHNEAEVEA